MEDAKEGAKSFGSTAGKPIVCKAAVLWKPHEEYTIQNIVVAPPEKDQVRLKVLYTSICHTDLTVGKMEVLAKAFPAILGHEAVGIVESVGEGVEGIEAGDYALPFAQGQCTECSYCNSTRTNDCERYPIRALSPTLAEAEEPTYTTEDGKIISIFVGTATFSQYIVVHKRSIVKINPAAPLDKVGILTCGLATGFGSVWNVAKVPKGATVAVFGLGTIGLAVVEACKIAGASRIIGVDINPQKAELSKKFGVTEFVNPKDHPDKSISEVIKDMTGGGVQYSFECIGISKVMTEAVESSHKIVGVTVILGYAGGREKFEITSQDFIYGRNVMGAMLGRFKLSDLPGLVERALSKDFDLDAYITHQMPFSKINEALKIFESGESLRITLDTSH